MIDVPALVIQLAPFVSAIIVEVFVKGIRTPSFSFEDATENFKFYVQDGVNSAGTYDEVDETTKAYIDQRVDRTLRKTNAQAAITSHFDLTIIAVILIYFGRVAQRDGLTPWSAVFGVFVVLLLFWIKDRFNAKIHSWDEEEYEEREIVQGLKRRLGSVERRETDSNKELSDGGEGDDAPDGGFRIEYGQGGVIVAHSIAILSLLVLNVFLL
jgi:hypothetical protein